MVRIIPNRLKSHNGSLPGSRSSSPMRGNLQPLILKTTVMRGRNLAAKDKGGTSDPYLILTLGDTRQSTQTIAKNLNPEWFVSFDLPILGPPSMLLQAICWDKDRFGKDYMGEFEVMVDEIFANGETAQEPKWYTLKSRRKDSKKKGGQVSGDIQLQFSIVDSSNPDATAEQILTKLNSVTALSPEEEKQEDAELAQIQKGSPDELADDDDDDDDDLEEDSTDETEDTAKPETVEKRKRRLRLKRLKRKTKARVYEFAAGRDCVGILFLEIGKVTDLPPERNVTRTSFDMDPFVIASLGRRTFRTRVIRHNLNPVFDEKMVFQVMRHEQQYSMKFSVVDRDKLSGNDFIAKVDFPISTFISVAPEADPETGLYKLREPSEPSTPVPKSRFRLPLSRSASSTSLNKIPIRPVLSSRPSQGSITTYGAAELVPAPTSVPSDPNALTPYPSNTGPETGEETPLVTVAPAEDDPDLKKYEIPLELKNKEKWSDKHPTQLQIRVKYMPYNALRQQFWRAMLKQYDADESQKISKVELTTMLDTLGSTLKESTIDQFFKRFAAEKDGKDTSNMELTFDQAVMGLEDYIQQNQRRGAGEQIKDALSKVSARALGGNASVLPGQEQITKSPTTSDAPTDEDPTTAAVPSLEEGEEDRTEELEKNDLVDDRGVEHIIEIRECPICHQPRLNKRSDTDIITHIATCASGDWRQVNNLVMAGFVTSSQAQRKWYSKIVTKIGYGGYKLGANSANILVQDRLTGQINEERMSVYVRLGIRLLYKGLGSRDMETKRIRKLLRSMSMKQGRKFDDPVSASQIQGFVDFHQLDMSEVLLPVEKFKNFNEFFYRALKPDARPCSAPENPRIIVSPADCRSVVFNSIDEATKIWVKGREFSLERLLGNAYPQDAKRYKGGALGVFRLAPQDYHRFHVPVDGIMDTPKLIEGEYYTVNPMAIRSTLDVYGENIRVIVPIDSVAHGRVMVICVGAMMVGSTVITRKAGEKLGRAEELGYFKFGGSTILVLFEPGTMRFDDDLADNASGALETLVRVGMSIGHHPDQPQHTQDMRKSEENVTNAERQEAKRRIEGSLAPLGGGIKDMK